MSKTITIPYEEYLATEKKLQGYRDLEASILRADGNLSTTIQMAAIHYDGRMTYMEKKSFFILEDTVANRKYVDSLNLSHNLPYNLSQSL